jgi:hypothetical protein
MPSEMVDNTEPRTLKEARLEADYDAEFHRLNIRLCRRAHQILMLIKLASGTAAFTLVFKADPNIAFVVGSVLALLVIIEAVWNPVEKGFEHREWVKRYNALLARNDLPDVEAFERALAEVSSDDDIGVASLEPCAYNRTVVSVGFESLRMPLTPWQRFVSFFV